jgi:hypothetical protein
MFRLFFHAWERRLASVTKDRVVRPFEWGTEWLSSNGHDSSSPRERVEQWVDEVMRDTPAFFHVPETRHYQFDPADADRQRKGEAGTLRFESALTTPHDVNNVVVGRWFPAREGKELSSYCPSGTRIRKDTSGCRACLRVSASQRSG